MHCKGVIGLPRQGFRPPEDMITSHAHIHFSFLLSHFLIKCCIAVACSTICYLLCEKVSFIYDNKTYHPFLELKIISSASKMFSENFSISFHQCPVWVGASISCGLDRFLKLLSQLKMFWWWTLYFYHFHVLISTCPYLNTVSYPGAGQEVSRSRSLSNL